MGMAVVTLQIHVAGARPANKRDYDGGLHLRFFMMALMSPIGGDSISYLLSGAGEGGGARGFHLTMLWMLVAPRPCCSVV